jgi:BirA family transcriptional regulator, biotin operon repressor / biotin---[acetyl-CoA-carboxylase] ligase
VPGPVPAPRRASRIARLERLGSVTSTQDVVRAWLAEGQAEVCVAVADEQTAGRGRIGRAWLAPPRKGLLVSLGVRPADLPVERTWQLSAAAALAMLEAAVGVVGETGSRLGIKWPNDLVVVEAGEVRKLGGILVETEVTPRRPRSGPAAGAFGVASAVIGAGVDVQWAAADFPAHLAARMSSLSEVAGGPVSRDALLGAWLVRFVDHYAALLEGHFATEAWSAAQVTSGARLRIETQSGPIEGTGLGVDRLTGRLLLHEAGSGRLVTVDDGEVLACRVQGPASDV